MRSFGHKRPARLPDGTVFEMVPSPVGAVTREKLGGQFGPDKKYRLVVTLEDGDLIVMRPEKTRRAEKMAAVDVYRYMLRCRANLEFLERARKAKARKAERLAARRIATADCRRKQQLKENPL